MTDDLEKNICNTLEGGTSIKDTCALYGIGERTFFEWVAIGNAHLNNEDHPRMPHKVAERERFAQFAQSTTRARARMREDVIKSLVSFARAGNVQAGMFLLERSDPDNWGRQTKVVHEFDVKQLAELKRLLDTLNWDASDFFNDMISKLAEQAQHVDNDHS